MNLRALALGTVIGFVVAFAPSCGGSKCGPNNCNGCCDSAGKCQAKPNNGLNTTCGSAGNQCADCTTSGQVCNSVTNTCGAVGTGGGTGGGMGTGGGSTGGGGGTTCTGCTLPNGACAPGNTINNCGSDGGVCMGCPTGQLCTNQKCETPVVMKKIGDSCTTAADCQTSLGASAICKTLTSTGNAMYTGGYCTIPCQNNTVCGTDAFCVNLDPRYGEEDSICWDKCANGDPCRTPGYACYNVGGTGGCWLDPLPQQDAGPPADKIGNTCAADTECQNPPDRGGVCSKKDSTLGLIFTDGYCSTAFCDKDSECSTDAGATCVNFSGDSRCMRHCAVGAGSFADAGQYDCRTGYLCLSLTTGDGGLSPDGICLPPPPPAPLSVGQACTATANCDDNGTTFGDCFPEAFALADGGTSQSGFPAGYCTLANCAGDLDCGPADSGVCLTVNTDPNASLQTLCFASCPAGGQGQGSCRTGYVCESFTVDGGASADGYCNPRCDVPGGGCPQLADGGVLTCNTTSGYCE